MTRDQAGFSSPAESLPVGGKVDPGVVKQWFEDPVAVAHYARAAASLGLWKSEERVFRSVFRPGDQLLDAGCGAGRIALALARAGYRRLTGVDYSAPMIAEARTLAASMGRFVEFLVGDVRQLPFANHSFDGVVFGFNGLMQQPGRENRRAVLRELRRIVRPGGHLVFTTHDRDLMSRRTAWAEEREVWAAGRQSRMLVEFGDRVFSSPEGRVFMHVPDRNEILEDLSLGGWEHVEDHLRSELANEPAEVRAFSDECRFWIARAPVGDDTAAAD